ncbi:MAG: SDR family NAD(P)-dependent oxidoreductase [Ilumatobacteraceae bacterium]
MRVLVTGSARAIGASTVATLTARGHEVIATARDASMLTALDCVMRLALDVRDDASVAAALEAAGPIDAIVNNAAISQSGPLESFPLDRLRDMIETNTLGALRMVQHVAAAWRDRGSGVIVNISSVQGRVSTPLSGSYGMTKFAMEAMSETLHYELGHFGIRIVLIEPGYIAPGMKMADAHPGPDVYDELRRQWDGTDATLTGAAGRPGPELVANAIADAIDNATTPMRVRVGADSELVLSVRSQLDDASFEATMRQTLGLTW